MGTQYVLTLGALADCDIEFEMPDTPLEAAELIADLLHSYSGKSLYPSIMSRADFDAMMIELEIEQ